MKITIDIDCTPEEARRYMGLPDVAPMQEAMLKEMQEQMMANISSMQPTEIMKTWLPMGLESWMEMQKQIWARMTSIGTPNDNHS
ncbi:MAG: hypothetical protein H6823_21660 [Planctomycetaceae bacterium]|nr:hypothetical protein [Planctomycetales bacterium]MCB9940852.1 hypothetical protein [Planctomycetaceae bacterium]